ncbi:KR domain-containing protein [Mesorhizobium sp. M0437]|uniref:KR domain-containing protein n=1 Tax=Mesorhizobium sp. M0437 TaxID=2956945 RepID=UPI00333D62CE
MHIGRKGQVIEAVPEVRAFACYNARNPPHRGLGERRLIRRVIAFDGNGVNSLRLKPGTAVPAPDGTDAVSCACQADAGYIVTGGLGALGLEAAHYLTGRGARRLVLAGRRGLPGRETWADHQDPSIRRTVERILELERLGVTVVPLRRAGDHGETIRHDARHSCHPGYRSCCRRLRRRDDRSSATR